MPPRPVELKNPVRGINEDAAPAALSADEAVQLLNLRVDTGPDQLVARGVANQTGYDAGIGTDERPVGVCVVGDKMLTTWVTPISSWRPRYFNFDITDPTYVGANVDATILGRVITSTGTISTVAATGYTNDDAGSPNGNVLMPMGRPAYYEGVAVYPSIDVENTLVKQTGASYANKVGTRLVSWAGANTANSTFVGDANVGSNVINYVSGTLPAVGMFIACNDDLATPWAAPFWYEVLTSSVGGITISKPWGLGESTAVARSAKTFQSKSRVIQPQSPTHVGAVASHLERIFVGRANVRASVGNLQGGLYSNALKWSSALNPEKWPDQNVTLIGSEPNDMIMGLASLGKYLIIFKKRSIYVLAGDSESNFQVRKITGRIGCVDSRGIVDHDDAVIFPALSGIYKINSELEIDELTSRGEGHGVRSTYQAVVLGGGVENDQLTVSATVDRNDYLHVNASYTMTSLAYGSSQKSISSDPYYTDFPMSCYLPNKAWTRFQAKRNPSNPSQSPQLLSSELLAGRVVGLTWRGMTDITDWTEVTAGGPGFVYPDNLGSASGNQAYPIEYVTPDQIMVPHSTAHLLKVMVAHQIEYMKATSDPSNQNSLQIYGYTDPSGSHTQEYIPLTKLSNTILTRTVNLAYSNTNTYVYETSVPSIGEDALRGMYFRLRFFVDPVNASTEPTRFKIFKITAVVDEARQGRASEAVL